MKSNKESIHKKSISQSSKDNLSKVKQSEKKAKSLKNSHPDDADSELKNTKSTKIVDKNLSVNHSKQKQSISKNTVPDKTTRQVKETADKKRKPLGYSEKKGSNTIYISKSNALRSSYSTSKTITSESIISKSQEKRGNNIASNSSTSRVKEHGTSKNLNYKSKPREKTQGQTFSSIANVKNEKVPIAEDDYEDDFEDYESDFQECTASEVSSMSDDESSELEPIEMLTEEKPQIKVISNSTYRKVEEERRFDSGHYELAEARKRAARIESAIPIELKPEPKESANLSDREEKQVETKSLPLSTDEGFEDGRSGDFTKSPSVSQTSLTDSHKPKKEMKKKPRNRGKELMNMIKLDVMDHSLFECTPIPYEDFVRAFGKLNARQIAVQTKDDNLDIDIQTDDIECSNKWTQVPVICRTTLKTVDDIKQFKMEQIGVGGDLDNGISSENLMSPPLYDILRLNDFLSRAGKVVLSLLEKNILGGNIFQNEPHELTKFSEGFINLSTSSLSFLSDRPVSLISYSEMSNKVLMTIHVSKIEEIVDDELEHVTKYCVGCVWNICEPSRPIKIFYSRSDVTACCFHPTNYNIVFAGTRDGSINIWNLREDEMWHHKVTDKTSEMDWVLRSPTFTTAGNIDIEGHESEIVAISILSKIDKNALYIPNNKFSPVQICSLDSEGHLIAWSVLHNMRRNVEDVNSSLWGEIKLSKSQEIPLNFKGGTITKDIMHEFVHMEKDSVNTNNLYLATNTTNVLHATCVGAKINPVVYKNNFMDWCGSSTCIETCPFDQSYFLVGCNDGTIRLHSLNVEQSLLQLKMKNHIAAVKTVQWSKSKPFCLYVLDELSRIHFWDLGSSDILPMQTVTATKKGCIKSMQLSPCNVAKDLSDQYLAIGTNVGHVEIHKLKQEFYYAQKEDINRELSAFLQYVSIL